jgi:hypothetical protein
MGLRTPLPGLDVLTRSRMSIVPGNQPHIGSNDLPALTA